MAYKFGFSYQYVVVFLQCSALIDGTSKEDFVEEIKEEYEEIRDEHYDSLKVRDFYSHVVRRNMEFFSNTSDPLSDFLCFGKIFALC